ncbi:MAG: transposase [Pseudomonadota bacterium]
MVQVALTGWFTPVHIRSEKADRLRKDLEGHIQSVLKIFGIRMTRMRHGRQGQAVRDQLAAANETDPVLCDIASGFIAAHATLCAAADDLDKAMKRKTKAHTVARRLMTIPGVGPVNALSSIALVDDPSRFNQASDVGAFLRPTPKRPQSGEID